MALLTPLVSFSPLLFLNQKVMGETKFLSKLITLYAANELDLGLSLEGLVSIIIFIPLAKISIPISLNTSGEAASII